ncbi:MAG TPA: glutamate--tRNA ligase [Anaerohalosphaeraceae bacterium]|nr:glutamate--tRNA ligase [Anaerohalosphaeraceae bacterium]
MIVTRFAPSPTGYLHIGGARTALFNWLLARKSGGKFLLRIEDTDLKRNTPTATQQVLADLRWLGIDWDEGPEVGGPNGPYFQSQRLEIYQHYVRKLIEEKKAYYCFDTPEEIERLRREAEAKKQVFLYPRPARFPEPEEARKAQAQGRPVTVRLAVTETEPIVVRDLLRGDVVFNPAEIGDFVILKSDGFPTYHLAVVVDDELMGVTHVIRGQEHLMNTPNHLLLQRALGFRTPTYLHMSVTVSESGGKLSKRERPEALRKAIQEKKEVDLDALAKAAGLSRQELNLFLAGEKMPDMPAIDTMAAFLGVHLPEINVVDFLKSGYLPETMVNFLALLGWSPAGRQEIMDRQELIEAFDLSRLNKSNSLFDRKKLLAFNTEHIKRVPLKTLVRHFRVFLETTGSPVAAADDAMLEHLIRINEGARTLAQIEEKCRFAFTADEAVAYDPEAVKKVLQKEGAIDILKTIAQRLRELKEFTAESLEVMLRNLAEEKQAGLGKVAQPLRVAITGTMISPPIFDAVNLLGLERTVKRIERAIQLFGHA